MAACFYLFVCPSIMLGLPVATEQGEWLLLTIPSVVFLNVLMAKWRGWNTGKGKTQSAPKPMPLKEKCIALCFYLFVCPPVLLSLPVATQQEGWLLLTIPSVVFLTFLMAKWRRWDIETGVPDDFFEEQRKRSLEYSSNAIYRFRRFDD